MDEVPAVALPRREGAVRAGSSIAESGPPSADLILTRERIRSSPLALNEARRAWNRDRIGLVSDLRCECARLSCQGTVPAVAESHRRGANQFVVAPAHFDDGVVLRAADRFFVVVSLGRVIGREELRRVPSLERDAPGRVVGRSRVRERRDASRRTYD